MKHEQFDPKAFMFADDILEKLQEALPYGGEHNTAKKAKEDTKWRQIHEQLCLMKSTALPKLQETS